MSDGSNIDVLENPQSTEQQTDLGKYTLKEVIGKGGLGSVYKAETEDKDDPVAVKISHDWAPNPAELDRSEDGTVTVRIPERHPLSDNATEAEKLSFVHGDTTNPNIVAVHDGGTAPKHALENPMKEWAALELAQEGSLADLLRKQGAFSVEQSAYMGLQLADALETTQSNGLVHADLKPANVYVKKITDEGPDIVLGDFGIAGPPKKSNMVEMTMPYGAPEQLDGIKSFGTDVYSLGLLLYEFQTGDRFYNMSGDFNEQYYARKNLKDNQEAYDSYVRTRLKKLGARSPEMVALLEEMLALSDFDRPNIKSVKNQLERIYEHYKGTDVIAPINRAASSSAADKTEAGPTRKFTKVYTVKK